MTDTRLLRDSIIAYPDSLALFSRPIQQVGIRKVKMISHNPVNEFSTQNIIRFDVKSAGLSYIDLSKTLLKLKVKIVKGNNASIPAVEKRRDGKGYALKPSFDKEKKSTEEDTEPAPDVTPEIVAPQNNFMHSLLQRVDVWLQQTLMTGCHDNYAYLAYFKALQATPEQKKSVLQMQMYFENDGEVTDNVGWITSRDLTLHKRAALFAGSREVTMIGKLASSVFEVDRLLPQGTGLEIALYPHKGPFCLLSPDIQPVPDFKVVITEAVLEVATVEVKKIIY